MTDSIEEIVHRFAREGRTTFNVAEVLDAARAESSSPRAITMTAVSRRLRDLAGSWVPSERGPDFALRRSMAVGGRYLLEPLTASNLSADDVAAEVTGRLHPPGIMPSPEVGSTGGRRHPFVAPPVDAQPRVSVSFPVRGVSPEALAAIAASTRRMREALAPLSGHLPSPLVRPKWYRRFRIYFEPRDVWIGAYVGRGELYVNLLPMVVIRYKRSGR